MKTIYSIYETQHVNDTREGETFNGTITAAKRHASRNQCFQGTTLSIRDETGVLVAYKEYGEKWIDVDTY